MVAVLYTVMNTELNIFMKGREAAIERLEKMHSEKGEEVLFLKKNSYII